MTDSEACQEFISILNKTKNIEAQINVLQQKVQEIDNKLVNVKSPSFGTEGGGGGGNKEQMRLSLIESKDNAKKLLEVRLNEWEWITTTFSQIVDSFAQATLWGKFVLHLETIESSISHNSSRYIHATSETIKQWNKLPHI